MCCNSLFFFIYPLYVTVCPEPFRNFCVDSVRGMLEILPMKSPLLFSVARICVVSGECCWVSYPSVTMSAGCSLLGLRVPNCSLNNVFARGECPVLFGMYVLLVWPMAFVDHAWLLYQGHTVEHLLLCVALLTGIALVSLDLSSMQFPIAGFHKSRLFQYYFID